MSKVKYHPLPCPFCGAEVEVEKANTQQTRVWHGAAPGGCVIEGFTLAYRATRAATVKAWNKRVEVKP